MKAQGWKQAIISATKDDVIMETLSKHLEDSDQAKQSLRDKGYGWTGLSLLETVIMEVPEAQQYKPPPPEPQQNIFFQVLSAAAEMCGVTMEEVNSGRKYGDIPTVKQLTSKILSELKYSQEKINNELPMLGKRNAIQQQVAAATKYAEEKKPFLNVLEQLREKFDIGNRKG